MTEFQPFPKIPRLNREVIVTEKIDGTNAQVHVRAGSIPSEQPFEPGIDTVVYVNDEPLWIRAGSRTRWLTHGGSGDNFGFGAWAAENASELAGLGVGQHFGEWWGKGIQRGYGLDRKRFSLFNVSRWGETRPACCHVVPVLARLYTLASSQVQDILFDLRTYGSHAAPGFEKPEGIILYHTQGNLMFKATLEKDEEHKTIVPRESRGQC